MGYPLVELFYERLLSLKSTWVEGSSIDGMNTSLCAVTGNNASVITWH